jgi:hypothetical protein
MKKTCQIVFILILNLVLTLSGCGGGSSSNSTASWQVVGSAGFSAGQALFTSIAINSSGIPYVAYKDVGNSNKATVMKYAK